MTRENAKALLPIIQAYTEGTDNTFVDGTPFGVKVEE